VLLQKKGYRDQTVTVRPDASGAVPPVDVRLERVTDVVNSVGMKLKLIPAGTFQMGSPETEADRSGDEGPLHKVTIGRPFYLGVYEVTQGEFEAVTRRNPSLNAREKADRNKYPVDNVNYDDAVAFCQALSKAEGRTYRLPTEAEWEYACRAGATTPFSTGARLGAGDAVFDASKPYGGGKAGEPEFSTSPVGTRGRPNAWGLYDMHGNVMEWVADWYDANAYAAGPNTDPKGPAGGAERVMRGGAFSTAGSECRSACRRLNYPPRTKSSSFGFRVLLEAEPE